METDPTPPAARLPLIGLFGLGLLGLVAYTANLAGLGGPGYEAFAELWIYHAILAIACAICFVRGTTAPPGRRGPWLAFGMGLLFWTFADIFWAIEWQGEADAPYPSLSDAGYLATLPCFFIGIALLTKERVGHFGAAGWLDGALGALAIGAAGTALLVPSLIDFEGGSAAAVFTNLVYPLSDLLLISFVIGALVIGGVRQGGSLVVVGVGMTAWALADIVYLQFAASGSYGGGWSDALWPAGALLIASAAWLPTRRNWAQSDGYSSILLPSLFAGIALWVLILDHFEPVVDAAVWLAAATLLAAIGRLALSFRENEALVERLQVEAVTDSLTRLGNRRRLFDELEEVFRDPRPPRRVLAIFDLDGFKHYNDTFGHLAGDALLRRLGGRLDAAVRGHGSAYRLGGDEFCILLDAEYGGSLVGAAREAFSEQGRGFSIGASCGTVMIPDEAETWSDAMRRADQAMYAEKASRTGRLEHQTREILLRILREREPVLGGHVHSVARLAERMGRALELDTEELDVLVRAAELHDIGKIAIPDDVLHKAGPLDEVEWELMRKHTVIGQRIIGMAPAMSPVARAVRLSHERWDGSGYPDGIAGGEIPLCSRIIFICDAFDAIISDRSYRAARSAAEALAELRRNAGSQFDPRLVEIFCALPAEEIQSVARPVSGAA